MKRRFVGRRLPQTPYNFSCARAARARKCARQETAIRPNAESTPEFSKIEWLGALRSPMADEKRDRNCRTRSLSPRSCARRDSRQGERAGAIAEKHSARAPREIPRKRRSQQTSVRDLLNAGTCSSCCELETATRAAQAIFQHRSLAGAVPARKATRGRVRTPKLSQNKPSASHGFAGKALRAAVRTPPGDVVIIVRCVLAAFLL